MGQTTRDGAPTGRFRAFAAGVLLASVASACGAAPAGSARPSALSLSGGASDTVPWAAISATSAAPPFTIPGVLPCRAGDLAVDVHAEPSYVGGGPRNSSTWMLRVRDQGAMPCFVGSTVDVTFATTAGPLTLSPLRTRTDIVYLAALSTPGASGYAHQAVGEIDTFPCVVPPVTQMSISPGPGLGTVRVTPGPSGGFGVPCPGKQGSYLAEVFPEDCCSGYAASTQTSVDAPTVAHPGEHLRFLVTITNRPVPHSQIDGTKEPAATPMAFASCPTYREELEGIDGGFHTYKLNCRAARPIPANGSETFEMYVDVPAGAHQGPAVLVWSIDGSPTVYQTAKINIQVLSP